MRKHINKLIALLVLPVVAALLMGQVPVEGPGDALTTPAAANTQSVPVSFGFAVVFVIATVVLFVAILVVGVRVNWADKERLRRQLNAETHKPL